MLLSHGFTGSPYSMRPWGEYLAAQGYAVEVPLLPGHGTTWQDLNTTTWDDWYAELTRAFERLAAANDAVVVGGLSIGGALVLRLAADHPRAGRRGRGGQPGRRDRPQGRPAAAGAQARRGRRSPASPTTSRSPASTSTATPARRCRPRTPCSGPGHRWSRTCRRSPRPCCYFRSTVDRVVDELSQPLITGKVSSREVDVRPLEESYHVATIDNDAERIFAESARVRSRRVARRVAATTLVSVQPDNEDEAWRAIVENYGERPTVDRRPTPRAQELVDGEPRRTSTRSGSCRRHRRRCRRSTPDRLAAWAGCSAPRWCCWSRSLLGRSLPAWLGYVLVAWFVGGFLYLVVQMPSGPATPATTAPGSDRARRARVRRVSASENVEITGHLMDNGILSRVLDDIREYNGDYTIERFDVGRETDDQSRALITVTADDDEGLQRMLMRLQTRGVNLVDPGEADCVRDPGRRRLPRRLLLHHQPRDRGPPRRQLAHGAQPRDGLRPGRRARRRAPARVHTLPMSDVRAGMTRRVRRLRRPGRACRSRTAPTRRSGSWTPRCPRRSRRRCWCARSPTACARPRPRARRCCGWAARRSSTPAPPRPWWRWWTPASSTCSSPATRSPPTTSSRRSTAPASASTSAMGRGVEHGHEHHIRAHQHDPQGGLDPRGGRAAACSTGGIMHALVTHDKEFVLVGSVRDDGPLPDVYTDVLEGQRAMRAGIADVGFCLMVATMLHSVATGNILPGLDPAGLRGHQPRHGHQARRPRRPRRRGASSPTSGCSSSSSRTSWCRSTGAAEPA